MRQHFLFHLLFYLFEIAVGFVHSLAICKGVVVFGKNFFELHYLVAVDYAYQHRLFRLGIGSDGRNLSCAVADGLENVRRDLVGVSGYDDKLAGPLGAHYQIIAEKGGYKAVGHAQDHRLIVVAESACGGGLGVNKK